MVDIVLVVQALSGVEQLRQTVNERRKGIGPETVLSGGVFESRANFRDREPGGGDALGGSRLGGLRWKKPCRGPDAERRQRHGQFAERALVRGQKRIQIGTIGEHDIHVGWQTEDRPDPRLELGGLGDGSQPSETRVDSKTARRRTEDAGQQDAPSPEWFGDALQSTTPASAVSAHGLSTWGVTGQQRRHEQQRQDTADRHAVADKQAELRRLGKSTNTRP